MNWTHLEHFFSKKKNCKISTIAETVPKCRWAANWILGNTELFFSSPSWGPIESFHSEFLLSYYMKASSLSMIRKPEEISVLSGQGKSMSSESRKG